MNSAFFPTRMIEPEPVALVCRDGVRLAGHLWRPPHAVESGGVVINSATGVAARFYHRYARFLAEHGFTVLTYDYRGIGLSKPRRLRGCGFRWRDWGELDFDASVSLMEKNVGGSVSVVGHSIGGFLPGLAEAGPRLKRMLKVGAQYAWWGDYAPPQRTWLFLKWHVAMPLTTAMCGYFPGKRYGWLEDLPAGVAYEWSFRRPRFERSHPRAERKIALAKMSAVRASILAVTVSDDRSGRWTRSGERCAITPARSVNSLPCIRRTMGARPSVISTSSTTCMLAASGSTCCCGFARGAIHGRTRQSILSIRRIRTGSARRPRRSWGGRITKRGGLRMGRPQRTSD